MEELGRGAQGTGRGRIHTHTDGRGGAGLSPRHYLGDTLRSPGPGGRARAPRGMGEAAGGCAQPGRARVPPAGEGPPARLAQLPAGPEPFGPAAQSVLGQPAGGCCARSWGAASLPAAARMGAAEAAGRAGWRLREQLAAAASQPRKQEEASPRWPRLSYCGVSAAAAPALKEPPPFPSPLPPRRQGQQARAISAPLHCPEQAWGLWRKRAGVWFVNISHSARHARARALWGEIFRLLSAPGQNCWPKKAQIPAGKGQSAQERSSPSPPSTLSQTHPPPGTGRAGYSSPISS